MRTRIIYGLTCIALLLVEIFIALFVHDQFIRPYIGDVLVVVVIYCFARTIIPEKVRLMPLYVFIFAAMVEGLQYLHIVEVLGLQDNTFFRVLVGSVFDWTDIICYGVGCGMIAIVAECRRHRIGNAQETVRDTIQDTWSNHNVGSKNGKTISPQYDTEKMKPVIHCSICTGEQVAGFKELDNGRFHGVMLIQNDKDLIKFKKQYGIEEISKEY